MGGVLVLVGRQAWERDEIAFFGTTFGFRTPDRFLTAAHCVKGLAAGDLLIVDLDEPMERIAVEEIVLHPEADVAVLKTRAVDRPRHAYFFDTHDQFMPGESFTAVGYPSQLLGSTPDMPVGRIFRGHFQRFFRFTSPFDDYRYIAGEMSIGAPGGLSGGPVFGSQPEFALGLVTGNMEAFTERRLVADEEVGGQRYRQVDAHIINYGVVLLLSRVRPFLDEHAPMPF
jgi:hypothetical protein